MATGRNGATAWDLEIVVTLSVRRVPGVGAVERAAHLVHVLEPLGRIRLEAAKDDVESARRGPLFLNSSRTARCPVPLSIRRLAFWPVTSSNRTSPSA